jgi:hypothetical protein
MADLTRIQAAATVQITDASSSAVALTSALPASNAIGLVIRDAAQGQAVMASSRPIAIAEDQSYARPNSDVWFSGQSIIANTASQLPSQSVVVSVIVKAANSNTSTIYLGFSSGVTSSNGFELGPGESLTLPVNNVNKIYAIATSGSQNISYIGV